MLCPEFHGARIESIVELLSNGTGRGIVSCPITIHGTSDFPAIADFLNSDSVPISSILPALKSDKMCRTHCFIWAPMGMPGPMCTR